MVHCVMYTCMQRQIYKGLYKQVTRRSCPRRSRCVLATAGTPTNGFISTRHAVS